MNSVYQHSMDCRQTSREGVTSREGQRADVSGQPPSPTPFPHRGEKGNRTGVPPRPLGEGARGRGSLPPIPLPYPFGQPPSPCPFPHYAGEGEPGGSPSPWNGRGGRVRGLWGAARVNERMSGHHPTTGYAVTSLSILCASMGTSRPGMYCLTTPLRVYII